MDLRIINIAASLMIVALIVYTCIIAKAMLIPFVCAVVVWYLTVQLIEALQSLPMGGRKMPFSLALIISSGLTFLVLYALYTILSHSINNIVYEAPRYQEKLLSVFQEVEKLTGRPIDTAKIFSNLNITDVLSTAAYTLTSLAGNVVLILIYALFLLIEYKTFDLKIRALCSSDSKYQKLKLLFARMRSDIGTYIKIKTVMSFATGVLTYVILLGSGVKNAEFWGIFTFLMNYIPTLGSIVAVVLTLLAVAIEMTSMWVLISLAGLLITVHFVIGNLIETRYMGEHLNLSPLVILMSLAIWGSIWGVIGMLLCVPGMTIISIILANMKSTRPIAILLSADGKIESERSA